MAPARRQTRQSVSMAVPPSRGSATTTTTASALHANTSSRRTTARAAATRAAINIDMQMESDDDDDDDVESEDEPEDEDEDDEDSQPVPVPKPRATGHLTRVISSTAEDDDDEDDDDEDEPDIQPRAGQRQHQRRSGRQRVVDDDEDFDAAEPETTSVVPLDTGGADAADNEEVNEEDSKRPPAPQKGKSKSKPKPPPRPSPTKKSVAQPKPAPGGGGLRIKLKLPTAITTTTSSSGTGTTGTGTGTPTSPADIDSPAHGKVFQWKLVRPSYDPTGAQGASSSSNRTPTSTGTAKGGRKYAARGKARMKEDEDEDEEEEVDVESEDEDMDVDNDPEDEEDEDGRTALERQGPSASAPGPARPLTTRQAVLASMVDSSHIALDESGMVPGLPGSGKSRKKQLTEMELALRREETARKRKNLSEKKLEDEKAETINRLLKKQSRPRAKRTNTDSPLPGSSTPTGRSVGTRTPRMGTKLKHTAATAAAEDEEEDAEDAEGEVEEAEDEDVGMDHEDEPQHAPPEPTMFRWVSRAVTDIVKVRVVEGDAGSEGAMEVEKEVEKEVRTVVMSFSVPASFVPAPSDKDASSPEVRMEVDESARIPVPVPRCAVEGCGEKRKYRLVKDWQVGACGIVHLKLLERRIAPVVV